MAKAKIEAINYSQLNSNQTGSIALYLTFGLVGIILLGGYFLHQSWIKFEQAVNAACIYSIAFDDSACRHRKITKGRLPVKSEDDVHLTQKWLNSLDSKDIRFLSDFTKICDRVMGSAGEEYCKFAEAIGQEVSFIPHADKSFTSSTVFKPEDRPIEMRPLVDNSIRYYKSVGDVSSINQLQPWATSIKVAEDKIMNARIGKWRSTRCTNLSGKDTKECAQFNGMSMEFKHNSTITALPNGMVQEKSFGPNEVTVVGGNIIKYPSGSSLNVESATKMIFEWRGHLFHLERIS